MRELCVKSWRLEKGTNWRNEHTKAQEFIRKIVSVTRSRERDRIFDAFTLCEQIAKRNG